MVQATVRARTNRTFALRRFRASRLDTLTRVDCSVCDRTRGAASYTRTGSGVRRVPGLVPLARGEAAAVASEPPWVRTDRTPGRPAAAGRLSGDWASGRPIERIATPRAGIARCRLES